MTPTETRMASLLRQRMILTLVELAADLGSIGPERLLQHADELKKLRASLDNLRHVMQWEARKAERIQDFPQAAESKPKPEGATCSPKESSRCGR